MDRSATRGRLRLEFLDGLRGVSALYVVAYHFWQALGHYGPVPSWLCWGSAWACAGHTAVTVFIVLSGFCLALPVAREGQLRGGLLGFAGRRARRILPPYYAALALSLLLFWAAPFVAEGSRLYSHSSWPADGPAVLSHALLVHNLDPERLYRLNGPHWSVATEWQIYFLFALVLLPLWRRWGVLAAAAFALAAGLGLHHLFPGHWGAGLWLVGCFGLGMAAAEAVAGAARAGWPGRVPWGALSAAGSAAFVVLAALSFLGDVHFQSMRWPFMPYLDLLVGLTCACGIVALARPGAVGRRVRAFLESRGCAGLGAMSYSLYLTHALVVAVGDWATLRAGLSPAARAAAFALAGVPLCLVVAYGFYRVFERPFCGSPRRSPHPGPQGAGRPAGAVFAGRVEAVLDPVPAGRTGLPRKEPWRRPVPEVQQFSD